MWRPRCLLLKTLGPADAALVKGSRVGRLEDVVERFESESAQT